MCVCVFVYVCLSFNIFVLIFMFMQFTNTRINGAKRAFLIMTSVRFKYYNPYSSCQKIKPCNSKPK